MKIIPVPCLSDNYAYLLICESSGQAAVIDPSESEPLLAAAQAAGVTIVAILNTHHHYDHTGGNNGILTVCPEIDVYAYRGDRGRVNGQTRLLKDGQGIQIGDLHGVAMHNPGHTNGALTYVFEDAAFTGDTLFGAGCGRTFEGTAAQMYASLNQVIGSLPEATRLFFGHEYTENNLRFALEIEPDNVHIQLRLEKARQWLQEGQFTTPSTLKEEWQSNPFLRCSVPAVIQAARKREPDMDSDPIEVFRVLRAWKDSY